MPRLFRYHAIIALGSFALKNTPPIPVTCSNGSSFALADVLLEAPASGFVVAAATQSTANAPANAPKRRLRVSIFLFITLLAFVRCFDFVLFRDNEEQSKNYSLMAALFSGLIRILSCSWRIMTRADAVGKEIAPVRARAWQIQEGLIPGALVTV